MKVSEINKTKKNETYQREKWEMLKTIFANIYQSKQQR